MVPTSCNTEGVVCAWIWAEWKRRCKCAGHQSARVGICSAISGHVPVCIACCCIDRVDVAIDVVPDIRTFRRGIVAISPVEAQVLSGVIIDINAIQAARIDVKNCLYAGRPSD